MFLPIIQLIHPCERRKKKNFSQFGCIITTVSCFLCAMYCVIASNVEYFKQFTTRVNGPKQANKKKIENQT